MITNFFFRLGGPEPLIGPFLRSDLGKIDFEHAIQILQYWFITQTLVSNLLILHTVEDGESERHKGKNDAHPKMWQFAFLWVLDFCQ